MCVCVCSCFDFLFYTIFFLQQKHFLYSHRFEKQIFFSIVNSIVNVLFFFTFLGENDDFIDERPAFNLDLDTEPINNLDTEQPHHVDALDIDYAKVAKKVDIKRVKSSMWSLIKQATVSDPITMMDDIQSIQTPSDNGSSQSNFSFFKLRQNLPFTLRQNLNENLSTPISFVALLHLCNEKVFFHYLN